MKTKPEAKQVSVRSSKTVYIAWTNTDLNEGRGVNIPLAICDSIFTAKRLGEGMSVQGTDCDIDLFEALNINGFWMGPVKIIPPSKEDAVLQESALKEQEKRDAFDKVIERAKALGLSDEDIEALRGNETTPAPAETPTP